jgi:hypothetical protein
MISDINSSNDNDMSEAERLARDKIESERERKEQDGKVCSAV